MIDGEDINDPSYDRFALRRKLGIVFQYPGALFDGSRSYCIGDIHTEEGEVQQGIVAVRRTLDGRNDILFASLNSDCLAEVLANLAPDDTQDEHSWFTGDPCGDQQTGNAQLL